MKSYLHCGQQRVQPQSAFIDWISFFSALAVIASYYSDSFYLALVPDIICRMQLQIPNKCSPWHCRILGTIGVWDFVCPINSQPPNKLKSLYSTKAILISCQCPSCRCSSGAKVHTDLNGQLGAKPQCRPHFFKEREHIQHNTQLEGFVLWGPRIVV